MRYKDLAAALLIIGGVFGFIALCITFAEATDAAYSTPRMHNCEK